MSYFTDPKRRNRLILIAVASAVFLFVYIDDWGRDFIEWQTSITAGAADPTLRPLVTDRPVDQILEGVKMAAGRIRNWEYVGDAVDGSMTLVYFVRTNRVLRVKDDITIRIEDRGKGTIVSGDSLAQLHIGDLGRNPRNLRRFLSELEIVLEGSVPTRVLAQRGIQSR